MMNGRPSICSLENQLREIGCSLGPNDFRYRLANLFCHAFPGQTIESVLIEPAAKAIPFCAYVRKKLGCPRLTESLILGTTLNLRKDAVLPRTTSRRVGATT